MHSNVCWFVIVIVDVWCFIFNHNKVVPRISRTHSSNLSRFALRGWSRKLIIHTLICESIITNQQITNHNIFNQELNGAHACIWATLPSSSTWITISSLPYGTVHNVNNFWKSFYFIFFSKVYRTDSAQQQRPTYITP